MVKIISWRQFTVDKPTGHYYVHLSTHGRRIKDSIQLAWPHSETKEFSLIEPKVTIFSIDRLILDYTQIPEDQDISFTVLINPTQSHTFTLIQILLQDPKLCFLPDNIKLYNSFPVSLPISQPE